MAGEGIFMAEILPFTGIYYNSEKSNKISDLLCPSTDYLNPERAAKLAENANNFCNVICSEGEGEDKYKNAVHKLYGWLLRDVLVIDKKPYLYINEQNVLIDGVEYRRYGIIGLLKIEDYDGKIKKQEKTIEKYRDEKYSLLKETQCSLEPVVCLVKDGAGELNTMLGSRKPESAAEVLSFTDIDGNSNNIYRILDEELKTRVIKYFSNKTFYVIDDYRYEAALLYKKDVASSLGDRATGREPCSYVLVNLFNAYDKAMRFYPVNRLIRNFNIKPADFIKNLSQKYKMAAIPFADPNTEKLAAKKIRMILNDSQVRGIVTYGIYIKAIPNRYLILNMDMPVTEDRADSEILESIIFKSYLGINDSNYEDEVGYAYSDNEALKAVKNGDYAGAFLTNGIDAMKLIELADKGKWMPYNSISLYPKVTSGAMLYSFRYSKIG